MTEFRDYQLTAEVDLVPKDSGGLYYFRLRFPSDYELGLNESVPSERTASRVLSIAQRYVEKASVLTLPEEMRGEMEEKNRAPHLQARYHAVLSRHSNKLADPLIRDCFPNDPKPGQLHLTISAIRQFFLLLPVAYVGMCAKQSLHQRLEQHLDGASGFSERLTKLELGWNDLTYSAAALPEYVSSDTRNLERLFQNLIRPALSRS